MPGRVKMSAAGWDSSLSINDPSSFGPPIPRNLNADLVSFRPPDHVQWEVESTSAYLHHIEDAIGPVNLDFYPVVIYRLPSINGQQLTAPEFLEYIRLHFDDLLDHDVAELRPLDEESRDRWNSSDPTGARMSFQIDIPGIPVEEGASVIVSKVTPTSWIFSTMYTDKDGFHPVSGNREWGLVTQEDSPVMLFYTRGADRISEGMMAALASGKVFGGGHNLWSALQRSVESLVNSHDGEADILHPISQRLSSADVSESFAPTQPWCDLDYSIYATERPKPDESEEEFDARIYRELILGFNM